MNDGNRWLVGNEKYLAAAIKWLWLRLAQVADFQEVSADEVAQAEVDMEAAEAIAPPPAIVILGQRLGLSRFEQEVLLLCVAMELNTQIASLCAEAQDDPKRTYPTFALALALFDKPAWDVVSPERPLRYWRLIEINQSGVQPLTTSPLKADERVVNHIKGLNYLDDRLAPLLIPLETSPPAPLLQGEGSQIPPFPPTPFFPHSPPFPRREGGLGGLGLPYRNSIELPPSQHQAVDEIVQQLEGKNYGDGLPVIQLLGVDSLSKQLVAQKISEWLELRLYRLPVEMLPNQASELETFARLWERESLLMPIALYLDADEVEGTSPPLHRFLVRSNGLFFLDTREPRPRLGRSAIALDIAKPTLSEQQAVWMDALGAEANGTPPLLSGQFNLNLVTIEQIAQEVETFRRNVSTMEQIQNPKSKIQNQLWDACLASTRPRMDTLAQRLDTKATWDDIVLPGEEIGLLHQIADQVRSRSIVYQNWGFSQKMNRGMGISALFAGESGTGKTMAAEVIANDLRLNLYRIDLSAVVSKFIGETEKNLRRLFDAAEDGGAILFFDEADALFGKRSEVKDSHDRYANIEINYLLQRMEAFRGLAILATNIKSALDAAFMRRLRFIVNFPFPGVKERKAMWQKVFPPETPTENLDFNRLAQFNMTGASIHNIALNSAFLAAQAGTSVTMQLLLAAAKTEFRKLDRPINESDFRWQETTGARV